MKQILTCPFPDNIQPQGEGYTEGCSSETLEPHLVQQNYNFLQ